MATKATKKTTTKKKKQSQDEKIKLVLESIAEGMSVRAACDLHGIKRRTFRDVATYKESPYYAQYAHAREDQVYSHSDRILELVNKVENEEIDPQAAKVAIDTLKWICCKMLPKVYGDKQQVDVTSSDGSMSQPTKFVVELVDNPKQTENE